MAACSRRLAPFVEEIEAIEAIAAMLAPYEAIKEALKTARARLRALKAAFVARLGAARAELDDEACRELALEIDRERLLDVTAKIRIDVRDLGFRWGSCGKNGRLNFHWRIIQLPLSVIDYIVVHELTHMKRPDHSPVFWHEIQKALPGYRAQRDWLREKGGRL